jgi:hypothetical protein
MMTKRKRILRALGDILYAIGENEHRKGQL